MPNYAQVIVDVKAMQTNRPYTYQIPAELKDQIQVGMRVVVPFGKGDRKVQGFVVELSEKATFADQIEPKQIEALMDLTPVLNEEALALADHLARETFAFKIRCLHKVQQYY